MACEIKNEVEFPRKVDQEKIMVLVFGLGIEPCFVYNLQV